MCGHTSGLPTPGVREEECVCEGVRLGLATGMGPARTNSTGIPVPRWWVLYSVSPICGRLIEVARAIDRVDQFLPRQQLVEFAAQLLDVAVNGPV